MTTQTEQTSQELRQQLREAEAREAKEQERERIEKKRASAQRTIEQARLREKNWQRQVDDAKRELKRFPTGDALAALEQAAALGHVPSKAALRDLGEARAAQEEMVRQAEFAIEGCKTAIADAERVLKGTPSVQERKGIIVAAEKALAALRGEGD